MKKKKAIKIALISLACIVLLPVVGFFIVSWAVLPPKKLTPLVVNLANEYLEAELQCERIELTYFETFPYLGVALTNGKLISRVAQDTVAVSDSLICAATDSLVSFSKCILSVQPMDFLLNNKITVKDAVFIRPSIYGYINPEGKANWEIYQATDSVAAEDSLAAPTPPIRIHHARIIDGTLTYDDRQTNLYTHLDGFYFIADCSSQADADLLDIKTGWKAFFFESPDYTLENELALNLKSKLTLSDSYRRISITDTEILVNRLPFTLTGTLFGNKEQNRLEMDLEYGLDVPDLNTLLAFVPQAYLKRDDQTKITGTVQVKGTLRGNLGDSIYPVLTACCVLENGSLQGQKKESGIDSLAWDMDMVFDRTHSDSSFVDLSRFFMKGKHCSFDMQGKVTDLWVNPVVNVSLKGNIDFTEMAKNFLRSDTLAMEGAIRTDMQTRFRMRDITQGNYGKIFARGQMDIENFKAISDPFDVNMVITRAQLNLDSETKAEKFLKDQKLMNTRLFIDSLKIRWKDKIVTTLSQLNMALSAPATSDTTAIVPMGGMISFNQLRTLLPDSVWLWAGKTEIKGAIKPSASDKKVPVMASVIQSDSLAYIYPQYHSGILLTRSAFNMSAFPYKQPATTGRPRRQLPANRDSLRLRANIQRDTTLMLDQSTSKILRRWDVKGNVVFSEMKAFTPFFPTRIGMKGSNVQFTTNTVTLSGAQLQLGKSDFTLNGKIDNMRRAFLRGGKLSTDLAVASNYIDCNELMNTISKGMLYSEQQTGTSTADMASEGFSDFQESATQISNLTESDTSGVFVLPKFLDMSLKMDARKIDFNDLNLENVSGGVVMKNQSLQLTDLNMHSNIGCGHLTLIYTARDKRKAYAGFDLDMEKILVDKLISLFPSMDTLVPMLRSFEGIVDCQIAATCDMDSTMSIVLPTLYSACRLAGQNMVLLDGETFTEISKTLMFKNKKRNMIDNIAVDLVVEDNKIEVFPFLVEMDRYRVAVGGTHNLDMTFNYHLSVLKSPVPFKLGIDITGNLDDFKYKITKCKYKDLFKPAKSSVLDSTNVRLNVRQNIYEAIRKQLQAALFDKELLPSDATMLHPHPELAENREARPVETEKTDTLVTEN